jgi:hypothetical protein
MKTPVAVMLGVVALVGTLVVARPAVAHHSGAGFDSTKVMELTATVKEFQFTNPHTWLQVFVEDAKGGKVEWSLEWGSPNSLGRQGVRPSSFPPGAKITVRLNPMTNGAPAGGFVGAKFADGKTLGRWEDAK